MTEEPEAEEEAKEEPEPELCCLKAAASEARGTLKVFGLATSGTPWAAEEEAVKNSVAEVEG